METNKNWYYSLPEVTEDAVVMRYMKYDYLTKMLDNNKFYVPLKQSFNDMGEHKLPLKNMFRIYPAFVEIPEEQRKMDYERTLRKHKDFALSQRLPTSCWTLRGYENYLMWMGYTDKTGVCIKSTLGNVVASLSYPGYNLYCGKIRYKNCWFHDDDELFPKQKYFADERELRMYFEPEATIDEGLDHIELDVKPDILIDEVILSPFYDKNQADNLAKELRSKYGIKVRPSEIELM